MAQSVFQTKQGENHHDCEFERENGNKVPQTEDDRAQEEEDLHGDAVDAEGRRSQKHAAPQ